MKCIPECGYKEKPDNLPRLTRHLGECLDHGACKKLEKDPAVIWKDGEFTVVKKTTKKDRVFEVKVIKKEKLQLTDAQIKTQADYVKKPQVTQGGVSDNLTKPAAKRLKAELPEELQA